MDEAVVRFVRRQHNLLVGEANAERIKVEAGAAIPQVNGKAVDVFIRGRDLRRGTPTEVVLKPADISQALSGPIESIAEAIQRTLEQLPPEVVADIIDRGICLTGGGALLEKLDVDLQRRTGVRFFLAANPLQSVVLGCGKVLQSHGEYEEFLIRPA